MNKLETYITAAQEVKGKEPLLSHNELHNIMNIVENPSNVQPSSSGVAHNTILSIHKGILMTIITGIIAVSAAIFLHVASDTTPASTRTSPSISVQPFTRSQPTAAEQGASEQNMAAPYATATETANGAKKAQATNQILNDAQILASSVADGIKAQSLPQQEVEVKSVEDKTASNNNAIEEAKEPAQAKTIVPENSSQAPTTVPKSISIEKALVLTHAELAELGIVLDGRKSLRTPDGVIKLSYTSEPNEGTDERAVLTHINTAIMRNRYKAYRESDVKPEEAESIIACAYDLHIYSYAFNAKKGAFVAQNSNMGKILPQGAYLLDSKKDVRDIIPNLIPISVDIGSVALSMSDTYRAKSGIDSSRYHITAVTIWYLPTKGFMDKLPERYRSALLRELELAQQITKGEVQPEQACAAMESEKQNSYLGLCRSASGSVRSLLVYPNPANENINCKFFLTEDATCTIALYTAGGDYVRNLIQGKSCAKGVNEERLALGKVAAGTYIVMLATSRGEQVLQRIVVNP